MKKTTIFQPSDYTDVINKAYLDEKNIQKRGSLINSRKQFQLKLFSDKQSIKEILVQRAVKTTVQILFDKGLFDIYFKADQNLSAKSFVHDKTTCFKGSK